jgi:hypothetical protein
MNKTNTEPKTNWNQMQTIEKGGLLNPSVFHGALSMMTIQGAWGKAKWVQPPPMRPQGRGELGTTWAIWFLIQTGSLEWTTQDKLNCVPIKSTIASLIACYNMTIVSSWAGIRFS